MEEHNEAIQSLWSQLTQSTSNPGSPVNNISTVHTGSTPPSSSPLPISSSRADLMKSNSKGGTPPKTSFSSGASKKGKSHQKTAPALAKRDGKTPLDSTYLQYMVCLMKCLKNCSSFSSQLRAELTTKKQYLTQQQ